MIDAKNATGAIFPVLEIKAPARMEKATAPMIIGRQRTPDSAAEVPLTDWNQMGTCSRLVYLCVELVKEDKY